MFKPTNEDDKKSNSPQPPQAQREAGRKLTAPTLKVMETLKALLPALDTNLFIANEIYAAKALTSHNWNLLNERLGGANVAVSSIDFEHGEINDPNLSKAPDCETRLTHAACWTLIDLQDLTAGDDLKGADKTKVVSQMNQLVAALSAAGYTVNKDAARMSTMPMIKKK